jgi:CHAD domain-containing protein
MTDTETTPQEEAQLPQPELAEPKKARKSTPKAAPGPEPEQVRKLARVLFDGTRSLHELSKEDRQILEMAAQNFNLPLTLTKKKPFRAAQERLHTRVSKELSQKKLEVLAAVLLLQQRKLKRKSLDQIGLSPSQQREALTIAALLRIAIDLDHAGSHQTRIQKIEAGRKKVWVIIEGPEAVKDATAAQYSAQLWLKIGYPEIQILEAGEATSRLLILPELMECSNLDPDDPLSEAGRKVLCYHFTEMLRHEAGTRLGEDTEELHDMRVATRRLRAAFEVFREAYEPGVLKPHLVGLRAAGRLLGAVRDLDVLIEKARAYQKGLAEAERSGIDPLVQAWESQRQAARQAMLTYFDSQEYAEFKFDFNAFLNTPGAGARRAPADRLTPYRVRELAPVLIYSRLAAVRTFAPYLEDAPIEQLHALRIEFKKLRYTVEYFREVMGKEVKDVIAELKTIQDHLGEMNDAQVASDLLRQFIETWETGQQPLPTSERQSIQAVVNYLAVCHAQRHELMVTFQQAWEKFNRQELRQKVALAIAAL